MILKFIKDQVLVTLSCSILLLTACDKQDEFLDVKSNRSDVTPRTLKDIQALLNYDGVMNANYPQIALIGADNNVISETNFGRPPANERNAYTWEKDIFQGTDDYDWNSAYKMVGYCNIALEVLDNIKPNVNEQVLYNNLKGTALFYRSMAFYNIAQVYCKSYNPNTAASDLGIPIRSSSDANLPSKRSTVEETYQRILTDVALSADLLPEHAQYKTQPNKAAAYGLLAKAFLVMERYPEAGANATKALEKNSALLDYNSSEVSLSLPNRFPSFEVGNREVIFYATCGLYLSIGAVPSSSFVGDVAPDLYELYAENDLRKQVFYNVINGSRIKFVGSYSGGSYNFSGIATNELLLIRAECYARAGNVNLAMEDLNMLLSKRYRNDGSFTGLSATNAEEALKILLEERRKELPYTSLIRWEDLRRLNKDERFARTISRQVNGVIYTLPPNDAKYVFPIPDVEIKLYGLEQNMR